MSLGKAQAERNAQLAAGRSDLTQGMCVSIDWPHHLAVVNVGGGNVSLPMFGSAPFPGDAVWVGMLGAKLVCLGSVPKATLGTVAGAPVDGKVDVLGDDAVIYNVTFDVSNADANSYVPAAGHRVVLDWDAAGAITARLSSDAALVEAAVPAGPGGSRGGSATFHPVSSSNWWIDGGSWNKPELWTSSSNRGLWFYGTQIADTIPDGATVTRMELYVDEYFNQYPSNLARIATHPHASRPGGAPTLSGAFNITARSGWKDLKNSGYFDQLKTGAARGLGTNGLGYHKFSRAGVNNSGALYMEWN